MARQPFVVQPPVLARIPLLAADPDDPPPAVDPLLIEGRFLASRQAGAAALPTALSPSDHGRLAATLRAYEIRTRFRPTPHGVFAGVAPACFAGDATALRLGGGHRARSNPRPGWLAAVCAQVLEDPDVLPLLTFTTSNLVTHRGQRLEHEQQAEPGETAPQRISVRATDATIFIMKMCGAGATAGQILTEVTRRWPGVPEPVVHTTLLGLVRGGFLLTDLLPDDPGDDPLGHLLGKLPAAHPLRDALSRLRQLLTDADRYRPGDPDRMAALRTARELADELSFQERPLAVDVLADAHLVLPATLADEAAKAAGVLWRVGSGQGPLAGYHERFLDRYGRHRFVPLLEATDPAIGIGVDTDAHDIDALPSSPHRTAILAGLLADATARGSVEVVLDEATIAALARDQVTQPPPRTAEVYMRVLAASRQDLAAGRLHLAVCPRGGSQDAGSTAGRVAAILPETPNDQTNSSVMIAELVARPRVPTAATLAPPTGFARWRIPVGVPACEGDLVLDDLLLASDGDELVLWSARHDRQVIPVLYSRLASRLLPPLARLLQLLGHAGCRPWHGWSWKPLDNSPFHPRIRYKRTVLSPARWALPPAMTESTRDRVAWGKALDTWRTKTIPPPPAIIVTEDADRRLPLELDRTDDRELLRRYVGRGVQAVTEQPGGPEAIQAVLPGPGGKHVLELSVPFARRTTVPATPRPASLPARTAGAGLHLPGGEWLSLAIRTPAGDELLAELAAVAVELAEHWDNWFWLRYSTPQHGPHIRVRFHGDPATLGGRVLPAISAWCTQMIARRLSGGFCVEPYDQEIERYGGPDAIQAAEQAFAADSHLVLTVLTATSDTDQRLVMAALSAAAIARTVAGGDRGSLHGRHLDRAGRHHLSLLRPQVRSAGHDGPTAALVTPTDPVWVAWQDALTTYRDTLHPARRTSCASSLIHMHANRLLGGTSTEPLMRALATDLLALTT